MLLPLGLEVNQLPLYPMVGFESWPHFVFFSVSRKLEKKSERNELLVFRLFAQVLSAKLTQGILFVLLTLFIVVARVSVVHFNCRVGTS